MPLLTDIPNYFKKTFKGATALTKGLIGLVPAPEAGDEAKVLKGDGTWGTVSGGIGGSTGSTDNAILRADGTGGSTAQAADIVIDDATTSTQANVALVNNHSETNSALVLTPKGSGAFILGPKPDGTSTGGDARGENAVDLQTSRTGATNVASGNFSFCGGQNSTASALHSFAFGQSALASGTESVAIGGNGNDALAAGAVAIGGNDIRAGGTYAVALGGRAINASGGGSVVLGGRTQSASGNSSIVAGGGSTDSTATGNTASGDAAATLGGRNALADRFCLQAHASGRFAANGDAQRIRAVLRCKTTTDSAVEMALDGSTTYLTIPSGKVIFCNIKVVGVKSDGSAVATYERQYAAKNVGGTSSEVYAAVTIGTDNAASTSLAISTEDTGDYISIKPTGIASETWRWVASVDAVEVKYGS